MKKKNLTKRKFNWTLYIFFKKKRNKEIEIKLTCPDEKAF